MITCAFLDAYVIQIPHLRPLTSSPLAHQLVCTLDPPLIIKGTNALISSLSVSLYLAMLSLMRIISRTLSFTLRPLSLNSTPSLRMSLPRLSSQVLPYRSLHLRHPCTSCVFYSYSTHNGASTSGTPSTSGTSHSSYDYPL